MAWKKLATTSDNLSVFAATTSAQLAGIISDETGSDKMVFATSPSLTTPALGTPSACVLTNATALPAAQIVVGTMASGMTLVAPVLGTPASGTLTNCTFPTANINTDEAVADDAVTLAKMAGGTDGNLITYDTSGNPAYVATGDSGQVLTSAGVDAVPTFQTPATGDMSDLTDDTSPQLGANLDTNSFEILFDDGHGILDENSNEQLRFKTTASAVNYMQVSNSATGNVVVLSAVGSDTNVGLKLATQGAAGVIDLNGKWAVGGTTITTSAAELNMLDGISLDSDDLNYAKTLYDTGVTGTEFDYLDGVTSAIQTQLDAKLDSSGDTDLAVADGGTGVSTLTDGGVLLGSGTGAITALGVLADGEMIVGDGTTDPVAESGATLRTSIGCGPTAGSSSIVTTGAINAGSITSGFTSIDVGAGAITTTGTISAGDMSISGTLTHTNTEQLNLEDSTILLNSGYSGSSAIDAGIFVERDTTAAIGYVAAERNPCLYWDESAGYWGFGQDTDTGTDITPNGYFAMATSSTDTDNTTKSPIGSIHIDTDGPDIWIRTT
jgi:hypothetical protein